MPFKASRRAERRPVFDHAGARLMQGLTLSSEWISPENTRPRSLMPRIASTVRQCSVERFFAVEHGAFELERFCDKPQIADAGLARG